MSLRRRKRIIWLAAAVVASAGAATLVWGLALPVNIAVDGSTSHAETPGAGDLLAGAARNAPVHPMVSLDELQRVCGLDLRRPLGEAPMAASGVTGGPAKSPMTLRLVGTVNEPGHSMAMFQKVDGSIELCALGQSIDDAGGTVTVTRIEEQKVVVQYGAQSLELVVPPTP